MKINLTKLIDFFNLLSRDFKVQIFFENDSFFNFKLGEISYILSYDQIINVLNENNVKFENEDEVYEVLSKHIINGLSKSIGKKVYDDVI